MAHSSQQLVICRLFACRHAYPTAKMPPSAFSAPTIQLRGFTVRSVLQVHIMRRRARDREERLSAELSSVKAQLRETVDLLATKEEEVILC